MRNDRAATCAKARARTANSALRAPRPARQQQAATWHTAIKSSAPAAATKTPIG